MKVYFVRHGETAWNKKKKMQGQLNIPLDEHGIEQAKETAKGMRDIPFDCIFSSPLKRAFDTAQAIREGRDLAIIRDDRLKEVDFGARNGTKFGDIDTNPKKIRIARFFRDPAHYRPPKGGESYPDLLARADSFYKDRILPLEGEKENVLIVAHATIIRAFIALLNHRSIAQMWETTYSGNCAVAIFNVENGVTTMECENMSYLQ